MKFPLVRLLASGAFCLLVAGAAAQNDKQAEKLLKSTLKAAAKAHAKALKDIVAPATEVLQQTKLAAQSGASAPGDSALTVAATETSLDMDLADVTSSTVLVGFSFDVDSAFAEAGLPLPPGAFIGTGGVLDKRLARMDAQHRAALAKVRKASKPILKALAKQGEPAALRTPDTVLPEFAPGIFGSEFMTEGSEDVFALPPLRFTALLGYSGSAEAEDGSLLISGFTQIHEDVLLSGNGPAGAGFGPVIATPADDGTFAATITGLPEGNWRIVAKQFIAVATDYVGIPGAPDPGTDEASAAQVAKQAKAEWKLVVKQHAAALKQASKTCKLALKDARKSLKAGADPQAVLDDVQAALEALATTLEAETNGLTGVSGTAAASLGVTLDGVARLVPDQLVGFGGANDKASARIEKQLRRTMARAVRQTRAFQHVLAKKTEWRLAAELEPIPFQRAAPVKSPALPLLVPPLRFELLTGSSRKGVSADGILRVRVIGDDTLGSRVNLGVFGPDGLVMFRDLYAGDLVGGLDVRFPEEGPGDLPEGNYVAVLQQGSVVVSAAISVPGTD